MKRPLACLAFVALLTTIVPFGSAPAMAVERRGHGYRSWFRGNPEDVAVNTSGGAMLEGGRSDRRPAWAWFLQQAGYGDIVIICSTCGDEYQQYVVNQHAVDSVQTLKLTKRIAASNPWVVQSVAGADGVFIAGGDQSDYVRIWKDTPVEDAINAVIARGGAIGGVSAGLAVMGQFLFSAYRNTVTSSRALLNCFGHKIQLRQDMLSLPALTTTITDSHFTQKDRMGRLLTFMARIDTDGWASRVTGIGVDEDTAVLLSPDGTASVIGQHDATFLRMRVGDVQTCAPKEPVQTGFIDAHVIHRGGSFDVATWSGDPNPARQVRAIDGQVIWSTP